MKATSIPLSPKSLRRQIALLLLATGGMHAQVLVSGQASAAFAEGENGASQYALNQGNPTFLWRGDLFVDVLLADDIAFLSNFRIHQNLELRVDLFALRFSDIGSTGINLQAGQIDIPFGHLGERRFPKQNHFFRLPLMNEHLTTLCSSDYYVWVLDPGFAIRGDGVPLLDQGLYDLGAKVYGNLGMLEYDVAVINGMVSATGTYAESGLNVNNGFGVIGRLGITPLPWLSIGASYGTGQFMADQSSDSISFLYGKDPSDYPQHIANVDVEIGIGHFLFFGQAISNTWVYERDLKAFGYSAEVQYALHPRISLAARAGGMTFNEVEELELETFNGHVDFSGKWDRDVFRLESGVRVKITREALVKVVYEWNRTITASEDIPDNLFIVQTVLSF